MCLLFSQPAIVFKRIYQLLLKMEDTFLDFDNHPANCYRVALTDNPLNVHEVCNQRTHRGTISLRRSFEDLVCSVTRSQLCHPFRLRNCEQSPHRHPPSGLSMSC